MKVGVQGPLWILEANFWWIWQGDRPEGADISLWGVQAGRETRRS